MYIKPSDRICTPVPLFRSLGLIAGLPTVSAHGVSIIHPPQRRLPRRSHPRSLSTPYTDIYGVTTMLVAELSHPRFSCYDMSSIRFATIAGSAAGRLATLEIEERPMAHPAVARCAVIGVPDPRYGEQITAFSEQVPVPSDEKLRVWVGERLARFKQLKYIWWLSQR